MAELLSSRGWTVVVLTESPLGNECEISERFSVIRGCGINTLLRVISSSDALVINGGVSVPAGLIAWCTRRPFLVWHQMAGMLARQKGLFGGVRNLVEKWLCRRASVHVGVSRACLESKQIPRWLRSEVIYNPVGREIENAAKRRYNNRLHTVDILFVGRLIEGKGVMVLVDAIKLLLYRMAKLSVAVVGDGPCRERMESGLNSIAGLDVSFVGSVDASHIGDWYRRARCLVLPSTFHPEGMPLVIGEAQTFGLPVVASDQAANIEAVQGCGLVVPAGNVEKLAEALRVILTDKKVYARLRSSALRVAGRYSTARFADQVERVLLSVVGECIR